jgi:hypothetical protein
MNVCHPEFLTFENRSVGCLNCQTVLYDEINDFLKSLKPHFSLYFAQIYAQRTGNLDFRCKIPIENIPDVLPTRDMFVRYDALLQTIRLLGMINQPFVSYSNTDMFDRSGTLNVKIVENFLEKFQALIEKESGDAEKMTKDEKQYLVKVLKTVHSYVNDLSTPDSNVIDQFCEVYAPYAWSFDPAPAVILKLEEPESLAAVLKQVNRDATAIRAHYSPYSLQFEIVYVMSYVLLLSDDVDAIASLVLGLAARICKGFFVQPMREECRRILMSKLKRSVRNSTVLQNKIKLLQTERCRDHVSLELLRDIKTLRELFEQEFEAFWCSKHENTRSSKIISYAETQVFPSLLFADDAQYYAFALIMPYLMKHYDKKNDTLRKHVTSKAKSLMDVIERLIYKMKDYEDPGYWTLDAFKLFVGSDETFKDSFQEMFKCFAVEDSD